MTALFSVLSKSEYSKFHQKGCISYCAENGVNYPHSTDAGGSMVFYISSTAQHHGIQLKNVISESVYVNWICSGLMQPSRNIATLCHAFLAAVDLDVDESESLKFDTPYFQKNNDLQMVALRARICASRAKEYILIELA